MESYVKQINQICKNGCKKYGIDFNIPIEVSGRLKKTYGYVEYKIDALTKTYNPTKLAIAKFLTLEGNENELVETILHELAHYITYKLYPTDNHGHNEMWQDIAIQLGCSGKQYANRENLGNPPKPKYVIKCRDCKATFNYFRKTKAVKNIEDYRCSCGGKLDVL